MQRKIVSNVLFLGGSQAITWILTSVYTLVIPKYLGPAGIGTLALIWAISAIVTVIANAGTKVFILREIARYPEAAHNLVGPAILLSTTLAIICWGVVIAFSNFSNQPDTTRQVIYVMAVVNVMAVAILPMRATLQGLDKMRYPFYEALIDKGLNTALALLVAALNLGLVLVASTNLITTVPLLLLYCWWFFKHSNTSFTLRPQIYRQLLQGSVAFLIVDISFNLYLYLDSILLSVLTNTETVGFYNVPTRLFGTLLVMPVILGQSVLPTLSRLAIDKQKQQANIDVSRQTLTFLMCISLPLAIGTMVMADPIISFFYQGLFAPSVPIMIVLGWTAVPTYLGVGLYQILTAQNRQGEWTKLMLMAFVVNLALNLLLIPYFQSSQSNGGLGAAVALLITELLIGVVGVRLVGTKIINVQLGRNILKSLVAAVLMGLLIWPLQKTFLLVPILVGVFSYGLVAAFAFGLFKQAKQLWHTRKQGGKQLLAEMPGDISAYQVVEEDTVEQGKLENQLQEEAHL